MTILKRALNEAPTLAVIVVTILGLSESDAAVWKEAVASLSALGTWFLVRYSTDGPVTVVQRERNIRRALRSVRERRGTVLPMPNGEHAEKIAKGEARDEEFLRRFDRIENKLDNLIPTVAKIGGTVSLLVTVATYLAITAFGS